MGWWQVNADTLARSRFVISPLAETFASLRPAARRDGHAPRRARLADRPPARVPAPSRARSHHRPPRPRRPRPRVDRRLPGPHAPVRRDVRGGRRPCPYGPSRPSPTATSPSPTSARSPPPSPAGTTCRNAPPDCSQYVWEEAVRPYWDRRRRVLEADVVARSAQVSQGGWAAVLDALRPGTRWLGDNRLQVNLYAYPPREISGAELIFVPVTPKVGWVSWEEPERYAVIYPCAGALAEHRGGAYGAARRSRGTPRARSSRRARTSRLTAQHHAADRRDRADARLGRAASAGAAGRGAGGSAAGWAVGAVLAYGGR